ncbi:TPA: hypothetical protein ACW7Y1_000327 [Enterobacter hormaechei subsp. steigerwaltii]|uniref:hypothetical protein n=1 Tax=Enterobacter cloacae complex sp. P45RS TaxID=2779542 RepID=UPI001D042C58|nr:hypothetical protein [Enterobacter cloacae complex sp. P45RS]
MSNIDKQAVAGDVNAKTYYIHPAAFGSTTNPGYGHVPVVHADDFEKQRAKLEAAEKRIAELEAREVQLPKPINVLHRRDFMDAHRSIYAYPEAEVNAALADAGIRIQGQD